MPIAFDPDSFLWVCFPTDRDKPEATRPAFKLRPFTMRTAARWRERMREIVETAKTDDAAREEVLRELSGVVLGWRNLEGETLADVLTELELYAMAWALPDWASAAEVDLKKSGSQSQFAGAASAGNALTDATTAPAASNPST